MSAFQTIAGIAGVCGMFYAGSALFWYAVSKFEEWRHES